MESDERRRILLIRRLKSLEDMIANILETLQDDNKSQPLLNIVRSNASFEQIRLFLEQSLQQSTSSNRIMNFKKSHPDSRDTQDSEQNDQQGIMDIGNLTARHTSKLIMLVG